MKVIDFAVKRPVTSIMFFIMLILVGYFSFTGLETKLFPELSIAMTSVQVRVPGASASEVEEDAIKPIYDELKGLSVVDSISSNANNGYGYVQVTFNKFTSMEKGLEEVNSVVDKVGSYLPSHVSRPQVLEFSMDNSPILNFSVSGNNVVRNSELVETKLIKALRSIDGVTKVEMDGVIGERVIVDIDPVRLKVSDISYQAVVDAVKGLTIDNIIGSYESNGETITLKEIKSIQSLDQIRSVVIPSKGGFIYLNDVANVAIKEEVSTSESYINGRSGISIKVSKAQDANLVSVANDVTAAIADFKGEYPDYDVTITKNDASSIETSVNAVKNAALIGAFFAVVVLFIFLRDAMSTLVIAISIPVSILAAFIILNVTKTTINVISLGGLSLGVGMLVDNSIVVIENIHRHLASGDDVIEVTIAAVKEVMGAIFASTLTTIAVFFPTFLAQGMIAALFKDLAITVIATLVASFIVAITLVPLLASMWTKPKKKATSKESKLSNLLEKWLSLALKRRKLTMLVMIILLVGSFALVPLIGIELMPESDIETVSLNYTIPKGSKLFTVNSVMERTQKELEQFKEYFEEEALDVYQSGGRVSYQFTFGDHIKDRKEIEAKMQDLFVGMFPGVETYVGSKASEKDYEVGVYTMTLEGEDYGKLLALKSSMTEEILAMEQVSEISATSKEAMLYQVTFNDQMMKKNGIATSSIMMAMQNLQTQSSKVSTYENGNTKLDVVVELPKQNLDGIHQLLLEGKDGQVVTFGDLAELKPVKVAAGINRADGFYKTSFNVSFKDQEIGLIELLSWKEEKILPTGYQFSVPKDDTEMTETFMNLGLILGLAILLVYLVLASQFESFVTPLIVMFTVPLSIIGVIVGHLFFFTKIGALSMMGVIMLAGMIVNGAIVLIDCIERLIKEGEDPYEALIKASKIRLRPILMTALTTIFAMLPMAFRLGDDSGMMTPMAVAVVGGLAFGTVLTLIVIPTLYSMVHRIHQSKPMIEKKKTS